MSDLLDVCLTIGGMQSIYVETALGEWIDDAEEIAKFLILK